VSCLLSSALPADVRASLVAAPFLVTRQTGASSVVAWLSTVEKEAL
jgi:hypothetical protein